jgi:hypothetical protein
MLNPYDVFFVKTDGTYLWIGDADSIQGSWRLIEARRSKPEDKFMISDRNSGRTIEVEAGRVRGQT